MTISTLSIIGNIYIPNLSATARMQLKFFYSFIYLCISYADDIWFDFKVCFS